MTRTSKASGGFSILVPIIVGGLGGIGLGGTVTYAIVNTGVASVESRLWNLTVVGSAFWVMCVFGAMLWAAVNLIRRAVRREIAPVRRELVQLRHAIAAAHGGGAGGRFTEYLRAHEDLKRRHYDDE